MPPPMPPPASIPPPVPPPMPPCCCCACDAFSSGVPYQWSTERKRVRFVKEGGQMRRHGQDREDDNATVCLAVGWGVHSMVWGVHSMVWCHRHSQATSLTRRYMSCARQRPLSMASSSSFS
eukprot:2015427-Rhodomonas_salina.1